MISIGNEYNRFGRFSIVAHITALIFNELFSELMIYLQKYLGKLGLFGMLKFILGLQFLLKQLLF